GPEAIAGSGRHPAKHRRTAAHGPAEVLPLRPGGAVPQAVLNAAVGRDAEHAEVRPAVGRDCGLADQVAVEIGPLRLRRFPRRAVPRLRSQAAGERDDEDRVTVAPPGSDVDAARAPCTKIYPAGKR